MVSASRTASSASGEKRVVSLRCSSKTLSLKSFIETRGLFKTSFIGFFCLTGGSPVFCKTRFRALGPREVWVALTMALVRFVFFEEEKVLFLSKGSVSLNA